MAVQQLPVLAQYERPTAVDQAFLQALRAAGFDGDIEDSYAQRLIAATDNSIYQQLPQAVLYPRHQAALVQLLQLAATRRFQSLSLSPRGGGTGTNGQALNRGLIIDLSRYFKRVELIDAAQGIVSCEAGVIKDQLNQQLRASGWFFSPDLSTSNRATLGGMINTDASGQGSLVYGKTSDHVLALTAVLINGEVLEARPMPVAEAEQLAAGEGLIATIYREVLSIVRGQRSAIEAKFPPLNRFLTGYDLKHAYDPERQTIHLERLLAGSEGTLAFITEAKLSLDRIPSERVLVTIKYRDFTAALAHAPALVKAQATSVETIDSTVLNLARQDIIWHQVQELLQEVPGQALMQGINMVEFSGHDAAQVASRLAALEQQLQQPADGVVGYAVCRDAPSIDLVYAMRKKAVGLLGNTPGARKPVAFVEDTAVPPERLAAFIAEFRQLLDQHGLRYGMFGHVDAGVLHVRPALDLTDPQDQALIRTLSDQVVALTTRYGGLLWGEHGKGFRAEYAAAFFGDELYQALQRIKAAFDPSNRLNPGKICTPWGHTARLQSIDGPLRGHFDQQIPLAIRQSYAAAMACNGNGLCFSAQANALMCPSYQVSGDRLQSPKGRAGVLREWLRLTNAAGVDVSQAAHERRLLRWGLSRAEDDFNHQVKAAMDTCLACKACSSHCPVKVDVPTFRARFLAWYHQRYRRPLKDHLIAAVESLAPRLARAPRLSNALTHNPLSAALLRYGVGMVDAPRLSVPSLQQRWQRQGRLQYSAAQLAQLSAQQRQAMVVIVQDPFTSFYHAELLEATAEVISKLGFTPVLLPFIGNGKALHVKGFLQRFHKVVRRVTDELLAIAALKIPMLGVDAATVLLLRDEYRHVNPRAAQFEVLLPQQWLLQQQSQLTGIAQARASSEPLRLFSHCTELSAMPQAAQQWQQVFAAVGLSLQAINTGCCGMAGSYGHEVTHQASSQALYQRTWQAPITAAAGQALVTGYSCRCQVARFSPMVGSVRHPLELLAQWL